MDTKMLIVESLEEYISIVMREFSNIKPNSFYESEKVFFRGQNNLEFKLTPSLGRTISKKSKITYARFENEMIKTSKLQNPEEFTKDKYPINMLARMQHFGLPTRLLDITENALVALFFACHGQYKYHGKVYCFVRNQNEIHSAYSLHANVIASLSEISMFTMHDINDFWDSVKHEEFVSDREKSRSNDDVIEYIKEDLSKPLFVLPEMITEREKRQQAAFILFPNKLYEDGYISNEVKEITDFSTYEIGVSAKYKRKILRQLELIGISEQFLFPEIDKKCIAIKDQTKSLIEYDE